MDSKTNDTDIAKMESQKEELMPGFTNVNDFAQKALGKLMQATKTANELPAAGDDYDYYSSFGSFRHFCNSQGERLLKNMHRLVGEQGVSAGQVGLGKTLELEDKMDALIETNDNLLESVGALLDEASGVTKPKQTLLSDSAKPQLIVTSWNKKKSHAQMEKSRNFRLMHARNIARPQLKFKDKVDNSNKPFVPVIRCKPNALTPLQDAITESQKSSDPLKTETDSANPQKRDGETRTELWPHPYQYELDHFQPGASQLEPVENPSYKPLEATPLTLVDNLEKLEQLSRSLNESKEIAVDLEHHSYRSYLGFTCLMQISTPDRDYIVDTLELRGELHMLNESFTDPKIVKVLHGATMDIDWLQRDLGLYVVNMFDTGQASRTLGFPRYSLAHLLSRYCNVEADKQYQLADWRIRPLPEKMLHYAREDTHYLLYIYHMMKNELIQKSNERQNLLRSVIDQSTRMCLQKYIKPIFTDDSYLTAFRKNRKIFSKKQLHAFKRLFAWRDSIARQEDESTGYVLPMHMMFQIAEILPKDQGGVLACCNPVPPLVNQNIGEIHHFVLEARGRQASNDKKEKIADAFSSKTNTFSAPLMDPLASLLFCPHDLSHQDDHGHRSFNSNHSGLTVQAAPMSSLLGASDTPPLPQMCAAMPIIALFDTSTEEPNEAEGNMTPAQRKVQLLRASFANPFEMYMPSSKPRQIAHQLLEADKITMGGKTEKSSVGTAFQPLSTWILKKATHRPVPEKDSTEGKEPGTYETPIAFNPDVSKQRRADEREGEAEGEEETVPVRQMAGMPSKKRKHSDNPTGKTPKPKKGRRGERPERRLDNPSGQDNDGSREERPIRPFDYSRTDYSMFQDSHRESRGGGQPSHNHRERGRHKSKFRYCNGPPRPKTQQDSGRRSVTYAGHRGGGRGGSRVQHSR